MKKELPAGLAVPEAQPMAARLEFLCRKRDSLILL